MFVGGYPTSTGRTARGFTLTELLVIIAIIAVVLAVAVPSFSTLMRDMAASKARSEVFAALTAARSRAITSRNMVALHIFRDVAPVYSVARGSNVTTNVLYDQADPAAVNQFRWGVRFDPATGLPASGMPHIPTNQLTLRLEVPNPDSLHNRSAMNTRQAIEFVWPADHEPIVLPPSLGICRPGTDLAWTVRTELSQTVPAAGRLNFAEDFYIVFAEDGKAVTVLVDYDLYYNTTYPPSPTSMPPPPPPPRTPPDRETNYVAQAVYPDATSTTAVADPGTWSSSGFCLYDVPTFQTQPDATARYNYVNRSDNVVTLSAYTGLPLEGGLR
jgi:prepilin-type N-terminal cleavage/methylation domain-containing protein